MSFNDFRGMKSNSYVAIWSNVVKFAYVKK